MADAPTPNVTKAPPASGGDRLLAVTCRNALDCTAVGDFLIPRTHSASLVEHWDGTAWSIQPSPDNGFGMASVACAPTAFCFASGHGILRGDGTSWSEVVSAHRTPDKLVSYATEARGRGLKCIIAGAGGAAHLPGMTAAITQIPVLGVPVESKALQGMDSLLSIVQMPAGIPTATFAIGKAGATNAALFAVAMLANENPALAEKLADFRKNQTAAVKAAALPPLDPID